jgi:hypothetical protein
MAERGKGWNMRPFRKFVLFTVATIAAAFLIIWCLDAFGFRSPVFAFLANWLAMSWVAIVGQAVPFYFPSGYYDIQAFEGSGQVYEFLGIRLFKRLVRRGPLTIFSPTLRFPQEKTTSALQHLDQEMRKAETGHVLIFVMVSLSAIYALFMGWLDAVAWMLGFNIMINGYPIMLQRYNRIKLQGLVQGQGV